LVVDDGSEPPIQGAPREVKSFRNPRSLGVAEARNLGIRHTCGEFIAIFDDDVEVGDPTLLSRAVALAQKFPDWGAIGFRQLRPGGEPHEMQPVMSVMPCYVGGFFAYGALLNAAALKQVGLFEPLLGFYYEEIELSLRLLDAGYTIIYDPSLSVTHYQDERGRDQARIFRLMLRNTILTGFLRCPLWCVPMITLAALARHVRWTGHLGRIDFRGIGWSIGETLRAVPYVRTNRKPIAFSTMQRKRRLARRPLQIPEHVRLE
jgi:GT2 family glycosyltransferase